MTTEAVNKSPEAPNWQQYLDSWAWHLRAADRAPSTVEGYLGIVGRFLAAGHDPLTTTKSDVGAYLLDLRERCQPSTVSLAYQVLHAFFRWLVAEDERGEDPMARLPRPKFNPSTVPILRGDEIRQLLRTCDGKGFPERRDAAIVRCLADCGLRMGELCGMEVASVDMRDMTVTVVGKGRRQRVVPFANRTGVALDRYLRLRMRHRFANLPSLWLGQRGPLQHDGVDRILKRRAALAGIEPIHAHQFRHTWADAYLSAGGGEGNLMRLAGWRSRAMLDRYGAARATERAHEEYRALNIGGRW